VSEPRFNPVKTAQAAAQFLKLSNGSLDKYILIKLLYLLDRESVRIWGEPLTGDMPVSMEHGPVLSRVYDLTKGEARLHREYWEQFISDADPETNQVTLKHDPGSAELSRNEMHLIKELHSKFANFTWRQMKEYCHTLAEYENVGKTSKGIRQEALLRAVGKTEAEIQQIARDQREDQVVAELLKA
jgi:hypothetical protein